MSVIYTYQAPADSDTSVHVTFTDGVVTHVRDVNAVFVDGVYDSDATQIRVGEVAMGVENKIALGMFPNDSA